MALKKQDCNNGKLIRLDCTHVTQTTADGITRTHNWACQLTREELRRVHAGDLSVRPDAYRGDMPVNRILMAEMG